MVIQERGRVGLRSNLRAGVLGSGIAVTVLLLLAACAPKTSTHAAAEQSARARVSAAATSTAVRADEQSAAADVQSCIGQPHIKVCVEGKVPPAKRKALETCLAGVLTADGLAVKKFEADPKTNACIQTALKP